MGRLRPNVEALWLAESNYMMYSRLNEHTHSNYYQLYFFFDGSGTFIVDGESIRFKAGMFFFLKPDVSHGISQVDSDEANTVRVIEVKFVVNDSQLASILDSLPVVNNGTPELQNALYAIFIESIQKEFYYEQRVPCMLESWLYQMIRERRKLGKNEERISQLSLDVKAYIDSHYNEDITLDAISETMGCSKSYLCQTFKRDSNMTVNAYISEVRISHAVNCLLNSNDNIAEVAELCGYKSVFYFTKAFKRAMGVPPATFRRAELLGSHHVVGTVNSLYTVMHNDTAVTLFGKQALLDSSHG